MSLTPRLLLCRPKSKSKIGTSMASGLCLQFTVSLVGNAIASLRGCLHRDEQKFPECSAKKQNVIVLLNRTRLCIPLCSDLSTAAPWG